VSGINFTSLTANDMRVLAQIARASELREQHISQTVKGIVAASEIGDVNVRRILDRLLERGCIERSPKRVLVSGQYVSKRRSSQHIYRITPKGAELLNKFRGDVR
jgi:DNA-binding MarR family transcriptional regulator